MAHARYLKAALLGLFALAALSLIYVRHYLLFHSLAEVFAIVVAGGIFMVAWNARHTLDNHFFLFVGIAYLFSAGIDLLHMLAYKGMPIFEEDQANLPTQLWIAGRWLQSLSLLAACAFIRRRLRPWAAFAGFAAVWVLVILSIFAWGIFPFCFREGVGLSSFKIWSEYAISLLFASAGAVLWRRREYFDPGVLRLLLWSLGLTVVSELAFTSYVSAYGLGNFVGHVFRVLAFYLLYHAVMVTGFTRPYDLLYRSLKRSREALEFSERKFAKIFNSSPAAVTLSTVKEGRYIEVNDAFIALLGFARQDVLGRTSTELGVWTRKEDREALVEVLRSTGRIRNHEAVFLTKAGEKKVTLVSAETIEIEGEPCILMAVSDLTGLKRAEEELRCAHAELEARVLERTAELASANEALLAECAERQRAEEGLRESAARLRHLSSQLLKAQEKERQRIALELHDSLGQSLTGIKYRLEAIAGRSGEGGQAARALGEVVSAIRETVEDVRRIQMDLRPPMLDDLGVSAALEWLSRSWSTTYPGVSVERFFHVDEEGLPDDLKTVIFRIVQEAMNNVAKHSGAGRVSLSLAGGAGGLVLTVSDNGRGFSPPAAADGQGGGRRGLGLASMRERAELSGGVFEVVSSQGAGTTVRVSWLP